jgi:hypothetical protein
MPVILRIKGYRFWFYEADLGEPPHVHVGKGDKLAKFWVDPVRISRPGRFKQHELSEVEAILVEYASFVMDAWRREESKRAGR